MNQLLFDRSSGTLSPQAFARTQTSSLVPAIQFAPQLRFDGGEKEAPLNNDDVGGGSQTGPFTESRLWAHQSGVNSLALDIENRMYAG
jgi:DNA excision repair protein ERCC-8